MGGVRIQALQLPKYSTLTEEDGTYSFDVPVFCNAVIVDAPEYNLIQLAIKGETGQDASLLSSKFSKFYTDGTTIISQKKVMLDQTSSITVETDIQNLLAGDVHSTSRSALVGQGAW